LYFVTRGTNTESKLSYTYGASEDIVKFKTSVSDSNKTAAAGGLKTTSVNASTKKTSTNQALVEKGEVSVEKGEVIAEKSTVYDHNGKAVVKTKTAVTTPTTEPVANNKGVFDAFQSGNYTDLVKKLLPTPDIDIDAAQNTVSAKAKAQKLQILTGELVVEGHPLLEPDTVLTMGGNLFKRDLGEWYVKKVVHSITNGYLCTLSLEKGGKPAEVKTKGNKQSNDNSTISKTNGSDSKINAEDKIVVSGYDSNGKLLYNKTKSGKIIPVK
jgi:phage protein D